MLLINKLQVSLRESVDLLSPSIFFVMLQDVDGTGIKDPLSITSYSSTSIS